MKAQVQHVRSHSLYGLTPKIWRFFLGGGNEGFFPLWSISSHLGVQIGLELVRLIAKIGLNKFWTNVTSLKSLKKIFTHDISMIRRQKMVIFGVLKVFVSNFTYYNLY